MKYIFTTIIILFLLSTSCTENNGNKNLESIDPSEQKTVAVINENVPVSDNEEKKSMQSGIWDTSELHEPLNYAMYQDFRNGNLQLFRIMLFFRKIESNPLNFHSLLQSNPNNAVTYFNGIVSYDGSLNTQTSTPEEYCYYENIIPPNQLESVFAYLEQNSDFFFDNEEWGGLELPYLSDKIFFDYKNYNFALNIYDQSSLDGPWLAYKISKSVDDLSPDGPMYGLFQILENDIVPFIMQNEVWCK